VSFVKISELPAATQANATDQLETNQSGTSRRLTVAQVAAYVSGNLASPAITGSTVVSANTSTDALRITQTGTGNALVVEDSANPDSTPFVVDASGNVISGHTTTIAAPNYAGNSQQTLGVYRIATGTPQSSYGSFMFNSSLSQSPQLIFARSAGPTIGDFTLAPSGAVLGAIAFNGSDGTDFVTAANITAAVDGTSGPDAMPGRLVFGTTAAGAASPTERMRIDNQGRVGIGEVTTPGAGLLVNKMGSTSSPSGALFRMTVPQTATGTAILVDTIGATTEAAAFTLGTLMHYRARPAATFGAGSAVTNQYGFWADSALTAAANNFGFYSNIAAGVVRTITTVARTSNVVTITTSAAHGYAAGQSVTVAATTNTSLNGTFVIASVPTTTTFTYAQTAADLGSTADTGTTQVVGRFNFFANGTAPNFFGGATTISTNSTSDALRITQTGTGNCLVVEDSANPDATPFVVDAGGQLTVGSLTRSALGAVTPNILVQNNTSGTANGIGVASWLASTAGSKIALGKSRSATIGTNSIVSNGDALATISFSGDDGAAFVDAASITAAVDGTPSTNDMPGRLVFSTTADGAASPTERMRITQAGNVGIGVSSPVNRLQVNGSFGRGAPVTKTADFTLADTENWIICNGTGSITVTFPTASSWTGREVMIKTIAAQTVVSASSNVVPVDGSAAGTAILAGTAGKWATLVSDGTNWIIMAAA
jgi:hypothetical protein